MSLADWPIHRFTNHGGTAWVSMEEAENRIAALEAEVVNRSRQLAASEETRTQAEADYLDIACACKLEEDKVRAAWAEVEKLRSEVKDGQR